MKAKHRLLNYLINKGFINVENFYVVSISNSSIGLQGEMNPETVEQCYKLFGKGHWDDENLWLRYKSNNFSVTLTF